MAKRPHALVAALLTGVAFATAASSAAAGITVASQNVVSNNVELDRFDDSGSLTDGFYLHTTAGGLGAGYFSAFAYDGAGDVRIASRNTVSNNVEIDRFDPAGLLADGFYLHTSAGGLGAGYFSAFTFDRAGDLRVASKNTVSNNVEIDRFDDTGLLTDGFYLHTTAGGLGAGYLTAFDFDLAGNLWVASRNTVSNNVEFDEFDDTGLLQGGFYLHTSSGTLGAAYFSDFAFDPAGNLWVASRNTVSNNVEIDEFDGAGLLLTGYYLHTSAGGLGAGYFSDFDFGPAAAVPPPAGTVPEPASWSILALGLGLIGARSRRRTAAAGRERRSRPSAGLGAPAWRRSGGDRRAPRRRSTCDPLPGRPA